MARTARPAPSARSISSSVWKKSSARTNDLLIRPAQPSERKALEDLQRRASLAVPRYRAQLETHPEAIELPQLHLNAGLTIVAQLDGVVAGFAVVLPVGEGEAQLDGLFVEPAMQRKGVGAALVEAAADFAIRALSASVLVVTANPAALQFYQRHGFLDIGVTDTRFGSAPLMARALGA